MEWQPIETAPKKTMILVCRFVNDEWHMCESGLFFQPESPSGEPECWFWSCDYDNASITIDEGPSHWMPLPKPPTD